MDWREDTLTTSERDGVAAAMSTKPLLRRAPAKGPNRRHTTGELVAPALLNQNFKVGIPAVPPPDRSVTMLLSRSHHWLRWLLLKN